MLEDNQVTGSRVTIVVNIDSKILFVELGLLTLSGMYILEISLGMLSVALVLVPY